MCLVHCCPVLTFQHSLVPHITTYTPFQFSLTMAPSSQEAASSLTKHLISIPFVSFLPSSSPFCFYTPAFFSCDGNGWGSPTQLFPSSSMACRASVGGSQPGFSPGLLLAPCCPIHPHQFPAVAKGCCQLCPCAHTSLSAPLCRGWGCMLLV